MDFDLLLCYEIIINFDYITIFKFNCVSKKYNTEWLNKIIVNKLKSTDPNKEHIIPDYTINKYKNFYITDNIIMKTMKYLFENNIQLGYNDKIIFNYIPPEIKANMGVRGNTGQPGISEGLYYFSKIIKDNHIINPIVKELQENIILTAVIKETIKINHNTSIFTLIYDYIKNCFNYKEDNDFIEYKNNKIRGYFSNEGKIYYNHTSNIFKKYLRFEFHDNEDLNYYY